MSHLEKNYTISLTLKVYGIMINLIVFENSDGPIVKVVARFLDAFQ